MTTLLAGIASVYLLMLLAAFFMQRDMMYPLPRVAVLPRNATGTLLSLPGPDRQIVHAYHVPAREQNPTVVVFHGNAEQLADQTDLALEFAAAGLGTFAVEYPGYGPSSESRITEANVYAHAETALQHLERSLGVPRERTVLYGRSLGTGVAVEMAARGYGSRVILISPYTSMVELAKGVMPILPVRWLVLDRYDTLAKAPRIRQPVLVVHGAEDGVVPARLGMHVAEAIRNSSIELIPGAGHNDLLEIGGPRLWQRIVGFATTAQPQ